MFSRLVPGQAKHVGTGRLRLPRFLSGTSWLKWSPKRSDRRSCRLAKPDKGPMENEEREASGGAQILQIGVKSDARAFPGQRGSFGGGAFAEQPPGLMASALPPNFSWVVSGLLAGLAMPRLPAHYKYMHDHGIRHLVSLTERNPPYHDTCPDIQVHRLRIADFCSPSAEQIQRFLQIVEDANAKGEAVAVHCLLGFGRTGTMLACYLAKTHNISGVDAIQKIRQLRPGSIETYDQEKAVVQFYQRTK